MLTIESEFKNRFLVRVNRGVPRRITTLTAAVPKSPIYHYLGKTDTLGPEPTDLIVNAIVEADDDLAIYVAHVTDLAIDKEKDKGYFGTKLETDSKLIQEYHKRYRQFTRVYSLDRTVEKNYPLIINYQLLNTLYPVKIRRPDTFRWVENILYDAIWATASSLKTDRIQFISIMPPRTLKPVSYYKDLIRYGRQTDLRKIANREDLILLDLFKYYLDPTADTIIGKYLPLCENVTLAVRDDINVFYLDGARLIEWATEEDSETTKLDWIYGLFEYLISLRPVTDLEVDETYEAVIEATKTRVYEELDKEVIDGKIEEIASAITAEADTLLNSGSISETEYKANLKLATRYQSLPNPIGEGKLIDVLTAPLPVAAVPKSTMPSIPLVGDQSVIDNKVKLIDEEYITKYLEPHLLRTFMSVQNEGLIVTNIKRDVVEDAAGKTNIYSIQTKPVKGDLATFKAEIPAINPDGTFKMGGVSYRMDKQRGDLPIVKLGDSTVAMTNSNSKLFVQRGVRKANSYPEWLYANLLNLKELGYIKEAKVGNVFRSDFGLPIPDIYSILAMRFRSMKIKELDLHFDFNARESLTKEKLSDIEKNGFLIGTTPGGYVLVDEANVFSTLIDGKETVLGTIEEVLGLDLSKVPVEYSEVKIKGKVIPIGVLLAYWMGMEELLKYLGVKYEEYDTGKRIQGETGIVLRFKDLKVNLIPTTKLQALLVGGFTYFKTGLSEVNFEDMSNQRTYHHVFSSRGINVGQYSHYTRIDRNWIDPITKDLLAEMKEPTDIRNLLIRATELLVNKQHVDETDGAYKINKGYNRINDIVHGEMMKAITEFSRGSKTAKRTFTLNPKAIRLAIAMDSGVSPVAEGNPMQVSGEQERITFNGANGRSAESMVGRHRKFHKNDMGTISEGFTDNGKAGTILYYSANPNIKGMYGQQGSGGPIEPGNLLSNSTAINPFSLKDD